MSAFSTLQQAFASGASVYHNGESLEKLLAFLTFDDWYGGLPTDESKVPKRGVSFEMSRNADGSYTIVDLQKTKDDPVNSINLSDPRLRNLSALTWQQVCADENLLHALLFSIKGNYSLVELVRENAAWIAQVFELCATDERLTEDDVLSLLAHAVYILNDWQGGVEDAVFQKLGWKLSTTLAVRNKDGKFALVKGQTMRDFFCFNNVFSYKVVAQEVIGGDDEYLHNCIATDLAKGRWFKTVVAEALKAADTA